jgi:hypothetical protein
MKYPLGKNDRIVVFEIRLYSEGEMVCQPPLLGI